MLTMMASWHTVQCVRQTMAKFTIYSGLPTLYICGNVIHEATAPTMGVAVSMIRQKTLLDHTLCAYFLYLIHDM